MYRFLVMFPRSADSGEVDALIEGIGSRFGASPGCRAITRSAGALMGPGAQSGDAGWILEADFDSLEAAMTAIDADDFQDVKSTAESLTSAILLFELAEN